MGPHTEAGVAATLRRILTGRAPATALLTGNNRITVHVLRAIAGSRKRPALVGFDDFELADLLNPPVTVVALNPGTLGKSAAELLFARLDGDSAPPRRIVLPVQLMPRGSGEVSP
jgi:LacI family transcriptional regulator